MWWGISKAWITVVWISKVWITVVGVTVVEITVVGISMEEEEEVAVLRSRVYHSLDWIQPAHYLPFPPLPSYPPWALSACNYCCSPEPPLPIPFPPIKLVGRPEPRLAFT